jgi:hypothetical protein
MTNPHAAADAALLSQRMAEWLRGDTVRVLAAAGQLDQERYRVRGLDENGNPSRVDDVLDVFSDDSGGGYVAVRGGDPRCAAVGLYRGVRHDHAFLVITGHRVAVLRLRDTQDGTEAAERELSANQDGSLGGALRGLGRFVKASATEFAKSVRRPPLHERPGDAVLECPFELPLHALQGVRHWKQPLVPEFRGGPRFAQLLFTDGSWARIKTDEPGQTALLGPA